MSRAYDAAMRLAGLAFLLTAAGCAAIQPPGVVVQHRGIDWRAAATEFDRQRLRDWRSAFVEALASAKAAGHSAEIAREGVLLEPDAALGPPPVPNGLYRCRTIKLGAKAPGMPAYVTYPPFTCRIRQERDVQGLAKLSGSQRQVGLIFPGDALRQVFLGTLVLADENRAMTYGQDRERDVAGYVERIGPSRWRLIAPRPAFESQLDVLELVPA